VVNHLVADQDKAARKRVRESRESLAPLEANLRLSVETIQRVEQSLGFARS
jgi:hypothetical protein